MHILANVTTFTRSWKPIWISIVFQYLQYRVGTLRCGGKQVHCISHVHEGKYWHTPLSLHISASFSFFRVHVAACSASISSTSLRDIIGAPARSPRWRKKANTFKRQRFLRAYDRVSAMGRWTFEQGCGARRASNFEWLEPEREIWLPAPQSYLLSLKWKIDLLKKTDLRSKAPLPNYKNNTKLQWVRNELVGWIRYEFRLDQVSWSICYFCLLQCLNSPSRCEVRTTVLMVRTDIYFTPHMLPAIPVIITKTFDCACLNKTLSFLQCLLYAALSVFALCLQCLLYAALSRTGSMCTKFKLRS